MNYESKAVNVMLTRCKTVQLLKDVFAYWELIKTYFELKNKL